MILKEKLLQIYKLIDFKEISVLLNCFVLNKGHFHSYIIMCVELKHTIYIRK